MQAHTVRVECIGSDSEDGHAGRLRVGKKKVGAHYVDEKGWGSYRGLRGRKRSLRSHRAPPARLPVGLRIRTPAQARPLVRRSPHSHALARHSENRNRHMASPKAVSGSSSAFLLAPTLVPRYRLAEYRSAGLLVAPL